MQTDLMWDLEADELASDQLLTAGVNVDRSRRFVEGVTWKNWGRMAIRTIAEARRLSAVAAAAKVIAGGIAPEDFSISSVLETVQPTVGDQADDFKIAAELGVLPWNQAAYVHTLACLRSVRSANPHPPMLGPFAGYGEPQLSGIQIPITVLGVAALAATAYYLSEAAEQEAVVETEKAWAMAKAYSEIRIAEAAIAAGQVPKLSDWAGARGRVVSAVASSWFPYAAIGGGLVLLGGAAYLGATAYQERRENPSASRRSSSSTSSSRRSSSRRSSSRRNARPKATLRRMGSGTRENPSREQFIGQAMAGGASRKQAARLWRGYLSAQRAKAGRKGGKARARRANPNGDAGPTPSRSIQVTEKIQGLPVPSGKPSSAASSSARPSSKPAGRRATQSSKPRRAGSSSSSKPAKRARRNASAPASSQKPVAPKRQSATAKKGRSPRQGVRRGAKMSATARK